MQTPTIGDSSPVRPRLAAIENHPYGHLVRRAELARAARDRAIDYARTHLDRARELGFEPFAQMYRRVGLTYVLIARQRHRRWVQELRAMAEVSP